MIRGQITPGIKNDIYKGPEVGKKLSSFEELKECKALIVRRRIKSAGVRLCKILKEFRLYPKYNEKPR